MKKRTRILNLVSSLLIGVSAITGAAIAPNEVFEASAVGSKTAYEYVDEASKYFEDPQGQIWRFSNIYALEEGTEPTDINLSLMYSKGVVCEKYTKSEDSSVYVQKYESMFTWDTEGTYEYNGETYEYNLVSPDRLSIKDVMVLEQLIVNHIPTTSTWLKYYDYSKDGMFKINDLILMNKQHAATPMNFVTNLDGVIYDEMSADDFFEILDYYDNLGEEEIYIRYGDVIPQDTTTTTTTATTTTTTATTTTTTTTAESTKISTTTTTTTMGTGVTAKPTDITHSTTQSSTTTSTTTQATTAWTQPQMEDLVRDGEQIDEETYNILINTAKMFNIEKYKILWGRTLDYGFVNPGSYYCMEAGMSYGYGVQILPSFEIKNLETGLSDEEIALYKENDYICYRPIVSEDSNEEVLASFDVNSTMAIKTEGGLIVSSIDEIIYPDYVEGVSYSETYNEANQENSFNLEGWYLCPINDSGSYVYNVEYPNEYTDVEPAGSVNTWFTHEEINPDGQPVLGKDDFYAFQKNAEELGYTSYKICYDPETGKHYIVSLDEIVS